MAQNVCVPDSLAQNVCVPDSHAHPRQFCVAAAASEKTVQYFGQAGLAFPALLAAEKVHVPDNCVG